jgi:hypothetical protein
MAIHFFKAFLVDLLGIKVQMVQTLFVFLAVGLQPLGN